MTVLKAKNVKKKTGFIIPVFNIQTSSAFISAGTL